MRNNNALIGTLQVIAAAIAWGSLGIFSSKLTQVGLSSVQITTLRIVTAFLLILYLFPKVLPSLKALTLKSALLLFAQSLIGVLGMTLCYFYAVERAGVAMAVALLYTAPVFSLGLAKLMLGETISLKASILAVVAVVGVGLLILGDVGAGKTFMLNAGVLVGLLSGLCYSLYGILGKRAMTVFAHLDGQHQNPSLLVFFSAVGVSAMVLLMLPSTYQAYGALLALPNGILAIGLVLGLSLVGTVAPFLLYMNALTKLSATKASVFTIFEPLTAIVLAVLLLGQTLNGVQLLGVVLIIGATLANAL